MDESSLGILVLDEMETDFPSFTDNRDRHLNCWDAHSSLRNEKEDQKNKKTDADLINLLKYDYENDDEVDEINFKELGLDEEELAILMGDISDTDFEDDEDDDNVINDEKKVDIMGEVFKNPGETEFVLTDSPSADVDTAPHVETNVGFAGYSDVDTETELESIFKQNQSRISLNRPDLEGKSSVTFSMQNPNLSLRLDQRESAEGSLVSSPVNGNDGDDDSSGDSTENLTDQLKSEFQLQNGERICPQGIENNDSEFVLPQMFFQPTNNRPSQSYCIRPWGDESSLQLGNFQSRETICHTNGSATSDLTPVVFSLDQISARSSSLPNAKSATYSSINSNETFKVPVAASTSKELQQNISTHSQKVESKLPTTELAFYTDLRNECGVEDFMTDGEFDLCGMQEEFVSAADAVEMLNLDEKQFEEASFKQCDDNFNDASSNWMYKDNFDVSRPSWMTDISYDRVSIGKFLSSKTNPLGTLDGNKNAVERPNFGGNAIVSPRTSMLCERNSTSSNRTPMENVSTASKYEEDKSEFVSISFINKFIRDASLSTSSSTLAEQVLKLAREMKAQKKRALKTITESNSENSTKNERSSVKKISVHPAAQNKANSELLELTHNWEPVRPSCVFPARSSEHRTPNVSTAKTPFSVGFAQLSQKHSDLETPSVWIPQNKNKFPTSTPYCGNVSFPDSLSDSNLPSQIVNQTADDPTPKSHHNRIEPRTIHATNENTVLTEKSEVHNNNTNKNVDVDKTITDLNAITLEQSRRLTGGQDTRVKKSEDSQATQTQRVYVPPLNLFQFSNDKCDKTSDFYPLAHNTLRDCDESDSRTPMVSHLKQSYVQLPPLKKPELESFRGLGTTQLRDCDTVSLQRTTSIRVSSELKFDEVACVGIKCETSLPIQNLTSRWLKCNFQLISLVIENQSLPTEISPFIFKHETIIEPNSIDKFQIIYASRVPGVVNAELQVTAQPIVQNKPGQTESNTSIVRLTAEAEHPNVDILLDDKRFIDFGTLAEDSCTEVNFGLVNVGPASVPIRLSIKSTNKPWQGFHFSKKNLNNESPTTRSLLSSNAISFKMPGQSVGSNTPRVFHTLLAFRAPNLEANVRGSIITISATLNVEVDIPGNTSIVLHSIPLTARVGTVHLETLKDLEPVKLQSIGGKPALCKIPLRNSGSIPLVLEATIPHSPRLFTISPHSLQIPPGKESEITITFGPHIGIDKISSVLLLTLYPGGPAYEIQLIAEVLTLSPIINLESNKHFLAWGGVSIGSSEDQTLLLRNSCQLKEPCEIQISIRGATDDFWLITSNGAAQIMKYTIVSQEEIPISVRFAPISAKHSAGKVVIKPLSLSANSKQIRFVIPLVGYGGKSKLELIGLQKDERGVHTAYIEKLGSSLSPLFTFAVKNTGEWAAFVKVVSSIEDSDNTKSSSQTCGKGSDFLVSPNEFVVGSQKSVKITLAIRLPEKSYTPTSINSDYCVGALTILYGDEISRKKFRRALRNHSTEASNNACQGINFDVTYLGEDLANGENMPSTSNDVQLFYNAINHLQFQLLNQSYHQNINTNLNNRSVTTASPPVRELQMRTPKRPIKSWEIWPNSINFNIRKSDPKACFVQLLRLQNNANRILKFYFMWPGHLFNINPANGAIQPKELLEVSVAVIPSEILQWDGKVSVVCDNLEEEIKVNVKYINESIRTNENLSPVKVLTKEISFPLTILNCSSEFSMEMRNTQTLSQQWVLSSIDPAVVKTKNGDIRKVAYSAFRFTKMSGFLKPNEVTHIPITFLPLDEGQFIQKWELVIAKNLYRITLKLNGEGICKSKGDIGLNSFQSPSKKKQMRSQSLSAYLRGRDCIQVSNNLIEFDSTNIHKFDRQTVQLNNISEEEHSCRILPPKPPFFINHFVLNIKRRRFIKLPVYFKPTEVGEFKDILKVETELQQIHEIQLSGVAVRE